MAKVQIKSEELTPFGGIFSIMEQFDSMLSPVIDKLWVIDAVVSSGIKARDSPFADERVFLWRIMRGGCDITSYASSLVSSNSAYMQL